MGGIMKDIMMDLETLGTTHDAAITQIGACYFDRRDGDIGDKLCVNIEINSCIERGLKIDGGAVKFWLERGDQATFLKKPVSLSKALSEFAKFIDKKSIIWCHATFDAVILANAYHAIGQGIPYSYRSVRDIRTLVDLSGVKYKKEKDGDPKTHDALDDCIYQVEYCCKCCF